MDQVKDILRQMIKYRFWILVGLAGLFPLVAYLVASGAIEEETKKKAQEIKGAKEGVAKYESGGKTKNDTAVVEEKSGVLKVEVNKTWKALYGRQAPLMTWPEVVRTYFPVWGPAYPKGIDPNLVNDAQVEYARAYQAEVDQVYNTANAFDFETGKGVVVTPPKEALLAPATFSSTEPPSLKEIWDAQQKLWLQRTLLEVVAAVNKDAKDWDGAPIKEIRELVVGDFGAIDQQSASKPETANLKEAPEMVPEGTPVPAADPKAADPQRSRMLGGPTQKQSSATAVLYSEREGAQYKLFPIQMTVLMDQGRVLDLLRELEASPMVIQVREYGQQRPATAVKKPVKGDEQRVAAGGMGGQAGGQRSSMRGYRQGRNTMFNRQMMQSYGSGAMADMMKQARGGAGGVGAATKERTGKDNREAARKKRDAAKGKGKAKDAEEPKVDTYDPYYNIIEVTVYGQARFYNPPPKEEEKPSSESAAPGAPADATQPAADATKAGADAEKADAARESAPADETKTGGEASKKSGEASKKDEAPAKDDAAGPEDKKAGDGQPAKGDAGKDEPRGKADAGKPADGKDAAPEKDEPADKAPAEPRA